MVDSEVPITVVATHNPLAFLLPMTKFVIAVDGAEQEGSWGERTVTVTPGEHTLRMWFRYMGKPCGVAQVSINTEAGATTSISYRAPLLVFSAGKAKVAG
jgi:hypothetical protein